MTYQKVGGRILEYEKDEGNTKREESNTCRGQRGSGMWTTGVLGEENRNKGRGKTLKAVI